MVTTVVSFFSTNYVKDFAYINEPTDANIQNGVDDRFSEPGQDIHEYLENAPLFHHLEGLYLTIAEVYKRYSYEDFSILGS